MQTNDWILGVVSAAFFLSGAVMGGIAVNRFEAYRRDNAPQENFMCMMDGRESFSVQGADSIKSNGSRWDIRTEAVTYSYQQRDGEVCAVEN